MKGREISYCFLSEKSKTLTESSSEDSSTQTTMAPGVEPIRETELKSPDKSFLEAPFLELDNFESELEENDKSISTPEVPLRYEDPPKAVQGKLLR